VTIGIDLNHNKLKNRSTIGFHMRVHGKEPFQYNFAREITYDRFQEVLYFEHLQELV